MAVLWAQVEVHKAYAEVHEAYVEPHKAYAEPHKAYAEPHKAYVEVHKRSGTPCRGTQDARNSPGPTQITSPQGTNTV